MAASQRTHARTEEEQLQERLAQHEANRRERQKRRERTVSPEPENRFKVPEDSREPEITDAAFSLMALAGNAETSENMRELIRRVDANDQARVERELMYRTGTVKELLPQSAFWSVGGASASVSASRHVDMPPPVRPQARNGTLVTNTTVVNRGMMLPPPRPQARSDTSSTHAAVVNRSMMLPPPQPQARSDTSVTDAAVVNRGMMLPPARPQTRSNTSVIDAAVVNRSIMLPPARPQARSDTSATNITVVNSATMPPPPTVSAASDVSLYDYENNNMALVDIAEHYRYMATDMLNLRQAARYNQTDLKAREMWARMALNQTGVTREQDLPPFVPMSGPGWKVSLGSLKDDLELVEVHPDRFNKRPVEKRQSLRFIKKATETYMWTGKFISWDDIPAVEAEAMKNKTTNKVPKAKVSAAPKPSKPSTPKAEPAETKPSKPSTPKAEPAEPKPSKCSTPKAEPAEPTSSKTGASKVDAKSHKPATQQRSIKRKERAWKEPALVKDKLYRSPSDPPEESSSEDGCKRTRKRSLKAKEADENNAAGRASKKAKKSP